MAIKVVPSPEEHARARFRRESGALRALDLHGVVRLLDSGEGDGVAWIVMELVEGEPFPGRAAPTPWHTLETPLLSLLGTLARVHELGVVHRDLKPANVLVRADGTAVILDFGLARGRELGSTVTRTGVRLGTPRYWAPEQDAGREADARADLWAVGVMAWEALTGTLPGARSTRGAAGMPTEPLPDDVPDPVARTLRRMLALDPARRPAHARLALEAMRTPPALPCHLGSRAAIEAVCAGARAGRPVSVGGAPRGGVSHTLREAAAVLRAEGREVVTLTPGTRAGSGLAALVPPGAGWETAGDARAALLDGARARLSGGTVLVVDATMDAVSRRVVDALVAEGRSGVPGRAVLVASGGRTGDVVVPPLTRADLEPLFPLPERLVHLRSGAVEQLWSASGGRAGRVEELLDDWVHAGAATRTDAGIRIGRRDLDRIVLRGAGLPADPTDTPLDAALDELLAWVAAAGGPVDAATLARVSGYDEWEVQLVLEELEGAGAVSRGEGGRWQARRNARRAESWDSVERASIHARLAAAWPAGDGQRLRHLLAAGSVDGLAEEAARAAEAHRAAGRLGQAVTVLVDALAALGRGAAPDAEELLARALARVALEEGSVQALGEALDHEAHLPAATVAVLRGARAVESGERAEGLRTLESADPHDRHTALLRDRYVCRALHFGDVDVYRAAAHRLADRWRTSPDAAERAEALGWLGRAAYRAMEPAEGAAYADEAASTHPDPGFQVAALGEAAIAWLEAAHPTHARDRAERGRALAASLGLPLAEARAEWVLRALALRTAPEVGVDEALVEAARWLDAPLWEGLLLVGEAALAWRTADPRTPTLAAEAEAALRRAGNPAAAWYAAALRLAAPTVAPPPEEVDELVHTVVTAGRADVTVQVLGLLASAGRLPPQRWLPAFDDAAARCPDRHRTWRNGVFTLDEARAALLAAPTAPAPPRDAAAPGPPAPRR